MNWPATLDPEENVGAGIARHYRGNRSETASVSMESGYCELSVTQDCAGRLRLR
jgi:hypothetical protein